jgi:hypothetical protein
MDPTNSIVWTRKSFIGSLVSCRVGFKQNLGQKSVMDPSCWQLAQCKLRRRLGFVILTVPQNPPAFLWARLVKLLTKGDFYKKQKPVKNPQKPAKTRKRPVFGRHVFSD